MLNLIHPLEMRKKFQGTRGFPYPFGPTKLGEGINFSLFSRHATAVSLCLFNPDRTPFIELPLDPKKNRTGDVWHIFVKSLPAETLYGYRVDGPYDPLKGLNFDNRFILLDPYCKQVASNPVWGSSPQRDTSHIQLGVAWPHTKPFDWEEDSHPDIPLKELIIYEMHVRGFTQDPSSQVERPGSYLGLVEKIPYLKSLGINAVELMPLHEFNERDNTLFHPVTHEPLFQYWGYSTVNFFSPMVRYGTIAEFKTMVKALHAEGIEVILDVVYNHTAEGNEDGPTLSFKGLETDDYYLLAPNGEYYNFTGCGNTLNGNNPVVREFILDSLRYWVTEMHVDGFRFDLASILCRGHDGIPLERPPTIEAISLDPILAKTKLIAEPWDAAGLYQVGTFPSFGEWAEWNGVYRDQVRRFIKGTDNEAGHFATRLSGSEDILGKTRTPAHSINFITAHDGFTLYDLVSYNEKHNEENGEENRDGSSANDSWNCGAEGETDDNNILALRQRQIRNFIVALLISQGVPMILMGDEYGHTKLGNNNTWGHDSRLNWFQWDTLEKNQSLFRFMQKMIAFRKEHSILSRSRFLRESDIIWHGTQPKKPDWGPHSRKVAFTLPDPINHYKLYAAFNAGFEEATFHLSGGASWHLIVDTSKGSPEDFPDESSLLSGREYRLPPYSSIILKSEFA